MKNFLLHISYISFFTTILFGPFYVYAQKSTFIDAASLIARATLFLSPSSATILEGSTIEIPVFINTKGRSVNTIELKVNFDPSKMIIIRPSNDKSIIGIWVDPPTFSNTAGTVKLSGIIPNGITSESGLITTMTFRAKATGKATITISNASRVLANDGFGTDVQTEFGRGVYTILSLPPEGPVVFSETHPFQETWYNNNNPVLAWEKGAGVTDFSFILDNKPFSIPDNESDSMETTTAAPDIGDGLRYFHIKARKQNIWGATTHFLLRIDSTFPSSFKPKVETLTSDGESHVSISFFTTDALSGLDHFEVGVIEKSKSINESPIFVQAESPYRLALPTSTDMRVIVRAFDRAGNVREESVDILPPPPPPLAVSFFMNMRAFVENNFLAVILLLLIVGHYFIQHRTFLHVKRIIRIIKEEEELDDIPKRRFRREEIVPKMPERIIKQETVVPKPPPGRSSNTENYNNFE